MELTKGKTEKEGLIPVTCKILKNLAKKDDRLEYLGIPVGEVLVVGYSVKYSEGDSKIIVGLWDQTGYVEISFYNKNESQHHAGLEGYNYIEKAHEKAQRTSDIDTVLKGRIDQLYSVYYLAMKGLRAGL